MNGTTLPVLLLFVFLSSLSLLPIAQAATLFEDDFTQGLDNWELTLAGGTINRPGRPVGGCQTAPKAYLHVEQSQDGWSLDAMLDFQTKNQVTF